MQCSVDRRLDKTFGLAVRKTFSYLFDKIAGANIDEDFIASEEFAANIK